MTCFQSIAKRLEITALPSTGGVDIRMQVPAVYRQMPIQGTLDILPLGDNLKGRIIGMPRRDELVQIPINEQLIVELYSK